MQNTLQLYFICCFTASIFSAPEVCCSWIFAGAETKLQSPPCRKLTICLHRASKRAPTKEIDCFVHWLFDSWFPICILGHVNIIRPTDCPVSEPSEVSGYLSAPTIRWSPEWLEGGSASSGSDIQQLLQSDSDNEPWNTGDNVRLLQQMLMTRLNIE